MKHREIRMTNKVDVDCAHRLAKSPKRIPNAKSTTTSKEGRKGQTEKMYEILDKLERQVEKNNSKVGKQDEINADYWKRIEELEDESVDIKEEFEHIHDEAKKTAEVTVETLKKEMEGIRQQTQELTRTISSNQERMIEILSTLGMGARQEKKE